MAKNERRKQRGAALMYVVLAAAWLAIMATYLISSYERNRSWASFKRVNLELKVLAEDLKEAAKYLLLYEKMVNLSNPLDLTADLRHAWQYPNSGNLNNPCGFIDALAHFHGVDSGSVLTKDIFCPGFWRNSTTSNFLLEQNIMAALVSTYKAAKKLAEGHYQIELNIDDVFAANNFINLSSSPLLRSANFQKSWKVQGQILYDIRTKGDDDAPLANPSERLVQIIAKVIVIPHSIVDKSGRFYIAQESLSLVAADPRSFAIFAPYPKSALENWTAYTMTSADSMPAPSSSQRLDVHKTASYEDDLCFAHGAKAFIYGKVFFNGGVVSGRPKLAECGRLGTAQQETYHDVVILSQEWGDEDHYVVPSPQTLSFLREKFTKGVLTNFNAVRNLLQGYRFTLNDGRTSFLDNAAEKFTVNVTNNNLMMEAFIPKTNYAYTSNSNYTYQAASSTTSPMKLGGRTSLNSQPGYFSNTDQLAQNNNATFINPVMPYLQVNRTDPAIYRFLMLSKEIDFNVANDTNVFGLVMPESLYVNFSGSASGTASFNWYSLANLYAGLRGVSDHDELQALNEDAAQHSSYVSFPLVNLPTVFSTEQGFH